MVTEFDTRPPAARVVRSQRLLVSGLPMVLGAVLVGLQTAHSTISQDEGATRQFSLLSFGNLYQAVHTIDGIFMPYYAFEHVVSQLDDSLFALRLPSILAFVLSVGLVSELALRWWGPAAGLVAGVALAVNPLSVQLGAEARPYALGLAGGLAATVLLDRALESDGRGWYIGYAVALLFTDVWHLFAALVLLTHLVMVLGRPRRAVLSWIVAALPGAVLTLVLAKVGSGQLSEQIGLRPQLTLTKAESSLVSMIGTHPGLLLVVLAGLLATAVSVRMRLAGLRPVLAAWTMFLGSWIVLIGYSKVDSALFAERYLFLGPAGAALVLGAGVAAVLRVWPAVKVPAAGIVAMVVVVVAGVLVRPTLSLISAANGNEYDKLVRAIASVEKPGDRLIVSAQLVERGFGEGLAYQSGDRSFQRQILSTLPHPPDTPLDIRIVTSTHPLRTSAGSSTTGRVFLAAVAHAGDSRLASGLAALLRYGCESAAPTRTFGTSVLLEYRCPKPA